MNKALIAYNLSYYGKSLKFLAPSIIFLVFFGAIHSQRPIPIWIHLNMTATVVFPLSVWLAITLIQTEDITQQNITLLHVKNKVSYHLAKIISALVVCAPFYGLFVLFPTVFGFFPRRLGIVEILAALVMHFLSSLLGVGVGILVSHRKITLPAQVLATILPIIPFGVIYGDNALVRSGAYLLPPLHFIGERLGALDSGVLEIDGHYLVFVVYSLGYAAVLIGAYLFINARGLPYRKTTGGY